MKKDTKNAKKSNVPLVVIGIIASVLIVGGLSPAESDKDEAEKAAVEIQKESLEEQESEAQNEKEQEETVIVENRDTLSENESEEAVQEFVPTVIDDSQVERNVSDNHQMVLITETGKKYHSRECTDGSYYEVTLDDALRLGLEPCKKCYGG